jgi:hypothetical protein
MRYYRLYFISASSGHIHHFREFEAESDEAALEIAERWSDGASMELWNLERKLKHWDVAPAAND